MQLGLFSLTTRRDRSISARQLYQEMVERVPRVDRAVGGIARVGHAT
jgi:hypothetical protein